MNVKRMKKVAKVTEIVLVGITISAEVNEHGSIHRLDFEDAEGNKLYLATESQYSALVASVPAPPKMVERHVLTGSVVGIPVREVFEQRYEADARLTALRDATTDTEAKFDISTESLPDEG